MTTCLTTSTSLSLSLPPRSVSSITHLLFIFLSLSLSLLQDFHVFFPFSLHLFLSAITFFPFSSFLCLYRESPISVSPSVRPSLSSSAIPFASPSVSPAACPSVNLFRHSAALPSVSPAASPSSVHLSVNLSGYLSVPLTSSASSLVRIRQIRGSKANLRTYYRQLQVSGAQQTVSRVNRRIEPQPSRPARHLPQH
jgi:hypothetical protein